MTDGPASGELTSDLSDPKQDCPSRDHLKCHFSDMSNPGYPERVEDDA